MPKKSKTTEAVSLTDYPRHFYHTFSDRGFKDGEDVSVTNIFTARTAYGQDALFRSFRF
jgi:hypothetical protein